jgi:hypothetical protein
MIYNNLLNSFTRNWDFTRSETIEILGSINDKQLQFKPDGDKWQPLFWEFGCLIRSQLIYTDAIVKGEMDFSLFKSTNIPSKEAYKTKDAILTALENADKEWVGAIRSHENDEDYQIAWPGFKRPFVNHISKLAEHERIHHGQFISYFTLAGFDLPPKFSTNWGLS